MKFFKQLYTFSEKESFEIDFIIKFIKDDGIKDSLPCSPNISTYFCIGSSICDIASQFAPPPINVIIQSVGFVFSFIANAIGKAEQVIYEYKINDSSNTKYYWDGGLVMKRMKFDSRGYVAPIKKRTSHITIVVSDNK